MTRLASSNPLAGRRVLLGVTGGIAAYKACYLVRLLATAGATVQVVMTPSAMRFVGQDTFAALTGRRVHTDLWEEPGSVLHVRLARDAEVAVVAPATANVLAKMALGIADDLLTSTLLEASCPLVVAPAMHTGMWEHPATQANLRALEQRGAVVVGPSSGPLAAGDDGTGRMSEPEAILSAVSGAIVRDRDLAGRRIVVTAGPTFEPIDPVRFIGNHSSGKMGFAVAAEAAARGADVSLVAGPVTGELPPGIRAVRVDTAEQMRRAVLDDYEDAEAVIMAAAVADFRPEVAASEKLKKETGLPELHLVPTPDILGELSERKGDRILIGFAAETEDLEAAGRRKLEAKGLDLIVVNEVGRQETGFGSDTNHAMIMSIEGDGEALRMWTKRELATEICDRLVKLLTR